ncbi:ribose-5-phosphate isomerase [Alicyclobacillus acidoterrestris]|uniref:ribose 5-phosphate isomerase B n=1 Tax=Alicyclobacillus suci TaxID=2816080 RepID=UPI001197AB64|nr:ribose 5-phosphate isomerase B [Alicyclobacillus suci]GEO27307.1 ribose-5-phosphate isomerase [Alicyclobacillus acidoterrestris]
MDIAIGCDDAAIELKEIIEEHLKSLGHNPVDFGCSDCDNVDYPDVAYKVAKEVQKGRFERAILICGTGLGVAITANKVKGVRAAVCHDTYSAERARKSNNAQILTFGSRVIGPELAKSIVSVWMTSEFQGGNSARKVDKIAHYESEELGETNGQKTY